MIITDTLLIITLIVFSFLFYREYKIINETEKCINLLKKELDLVEKPKVSGGKDE